MNATTLQQHPFLDLIFNSLKESYNLTRREREVLQLLILNGGTNRELGEVLQLSEKTMKNHLAAIKRKFNCNTSREVQAVVFRTTILPTPLNEQNDQNNHDEVKPYAALSS